MKEFITCVGDEVVIVQQKPSVIENNDVCKTHVIQTVIMRLFRASFFF